MTFTVVYSDVVSGVTASDFVVSSGTVSTQVTAVTQTGLRTYTVTVAVTGGYKQQLIALGVGEATASPVNSGVPANSVVGPANVVSYTPPVATASATRDGEAGSDSGDGVPSTSEEEIEIQIDFGVPVSGVTKDNLVFDTGGVAAQ